jgi:hypothetical protein
MDILSEFGAGRVEDLSRLTVDQLHRLLARFRDESDRISSHLDYLVQTRRELEEEIGRIDATMVEYESRSRIIPELFSRVSRQIEISSNPIDNLRSSGACNADQLVILSKINDRDPKNRMYLSTFTENTVTSEKIPRYVVGLFGTQRPGKGREQYNVDIFSEGRIRCSCPDFRFRAKEKNIVCKHVCFVVCKIAEIYSPQFFESKILDPHYITLVADAVKNMIDSRGCHMINPSEIPVTIDFKIPEDRSIDVDTVCPICIDSFEGIPTRSIKSCPACKNIVHDHCIEMWLETHDTCVFCRSDIWRKYK